MTGIRCRANKRSAKYPLKNKRRFPHVIEDDVLAEPTRRMGYTRIEHLAGGLAYFKKNNITSRAPTQHSCPTSKLDTQYPANNNLLLQKLKWYKYILFFAPKSCIFDYFVVTLHPILQWSLFVPYQQRTERAE